jgi:hypothetical protein
LAANYGRRRGEAGDRASGYARLHGRSSGRSFFPEDSPQVGWHIKGRGQRARGREIVDWANTIICIGTIFSDYFTVDWTAMPSAALVADEVSSICTDKISVGSICAISLPVSPERGKACGDYDRLQRFRSELAHAPGKLEAKFD